MNSEEDDMQIAFNPEAAKLLFLKAIALSIVALLPLLLISWFQETLRPLYGDPTPLSPVYLGMFVLLIGWYVLGLGILLPRVGRRIDAFIERGAHPSNDSELDE
ncbi:MAG: hypothetical protein ACFFAY_08730 [Promethearchaeota archaeon]